MAWSRIAHTIAGSSGTDSVTTSAIDTTGANALFVIVNSYDGVSAPTLTDSASGNVWNLDYSITDTAGSLTYIKVYRASSPVVTSATHTFTLTGSLDYPGIAVFAASGHDGGSYDVRNNNTPGTPVTNLQTGSVTPSQDGSLVLGVVSTYLGSGAHSVDSPMTLSDDLPFNSGHSFGLAVAYEFQTTATTRNPNFTFAGARPGGLTIVYKPAAAATATYVAEDESHLPPRRPAHSYQPAEEAPIDWPHRQTTVVSNGASSSPTIVATLGNKVSPGSLVFATLSWTGTSGDTVSIADDQGNVYATPAALSQFNVSANTWFVGAFCPSPVGNPQTITATISTSRTFGRMIVDEYLGGWLNFDRGLSNHQTGVASGTDTETSGAVTPNRPRELFLGAVGQYGGVAPHALPGTGFSAAYDSGGSFNTEFLVQGAAASQAATYSPQSTPTGGTILTYVATFSQLPIGTGGEEARPNLPHARPWHHTPESETAGTPPTVVATVAVLAQEEGRLPPARPRHGSAIQDEFTSRIAVGTPRFLVAEEPRSLPPARPFHRTAEVDQGSWPFTAVATVGRLVAEEPGRLPPRRPAHASPAQDELNAIFASAPTVFKTIDEDDRRLPPGRPWHRLADLDQGGWLFTVVATTGRLIIDEPPRLPPRRPYHRLPDVDEGAWPFSVAPLNTATYLPEDEQHRPRQRPWHSLLGEDAELIVPPPAPVSLFYAYGQAGARSVG